MAIGSSAIDPRGRGAAGAGRPACFAQTSPPMATTATPKYDRDNLVNLLAERAAFERAAVMLYDTLLESLDATDEPLVVSSMAALRRHRDEEREHAEWVERLLAKLGGRPRRDLPDAAM